VATLLDGVLLGVPASALSAAFGVETASSGFDLTALSVTGSGWLLVVRA
jgi:hypothetical protein